MTRLTKRSGTGDCEILKTMIEKLADYEDAEEMKENGC